MADKFFVVTTNPEDKVVNIVGPFASAERANKWGVAWQERHGDCLCWSSLALGGGAKMIRRGATWKG